MRPTWIIKALLCLTPCTLLAQDHWVATWATSQQLYRAAPAQPARSAIPPPPSPAAPRTPGRRFPVPPGRASLHNQTIRMIARTSIGGSNVRIWLSSALGSGTVVFGAAHIGIRAEASAILPGTDRVLAAFGGKTSATLYAGQTLVSDPVSLALPPLAHVAVSVYIPGETASPTSHTFALHTWPIYLRKATSHPQSAIPGMPTPANPGIGWPESMSPHPPTPARVAVVNAGNFRQPIAGR